MTETSLISIILPVYNGEKYLEQALQSCLNQTYKNFELIIVDDASTDNSLSIVKKFENKDDRIKVLLNVKNLSLPSSLNVGHKHAKGEYITWTSDDNILKPYFLSSLYKAITREYCDVVFSDYDIIWSNGELKRKHISGPIPYLILGNIIGASFLYRKEVFWELNGFDVSLFLLEDYHFFLKAALKYKFYHLEENLYQYRLHEESLTAKIEKDVLYKNKFEISLRDTYRDLDLQLNEETINLLKDLFFKNPVDMEDFFKNRFLIKRDITKFQNSLYNLNESLAIDQLEYLVWINWFENRDEHTFKNLIFVILKDRKFLFTKDHNIKATVKLIARCLYPKFWNY